MRSGIQPVWRDGRDLDFHKSFGATLVLPEEYLVDAGLTMPDQMADQNPYECTEYTIRDLMTDIKKILYVPGYLYAKTLCLAGLPPTTQGVQIRSALKAARVYGLLPLDKTPNDLKNTGESYNADWKNWPLSLDAEAAKHKVGKYFNIQPLDGSWFDGIRSAIYTNKCGALVGTPWYREWNNIGSDGIVPVFSAKILSWHAWKVVGWTSINGVHYLVGKTWQGKKYGKEGYALFSREIIEKLWNIYGTQAFTLAEATTEDLPTIKADILEAIMTFFARLKAQLA